MHEVKLKVLPGRHMRDAIGVFLRQIGHSFQLASVQTAKGNLDPLHAGSIPQRVGTFRVVVGGIDEVLHLPAIVPLPVVVSLAVHASPESGFREKPFFQPTLLSQRNLCLKNINLSR